MAADTIPTFREFMFGGEAAALAQLLNLLPNYLPADWQRDQQSEAAARGMGDDSGEYRCYHFVGNSQLPEATLWLFVGQNQAQVVNIVAPNEFELGHGRYNALLAQFEAAVGQAIAATGLAVTVVPWQEPTLEQVLDDESARLFKRFARLANPDTGTLNPVDTERWQDFLISVHRHQLTPDPGLLRRWLEAEHRWPEETIDRTLDELHTGLDLLRRYQQTLPPSTYEHAA